MKGSIIHWVFIISIRCACRRLLICSVFTYTQTPSEIGVLILILAVWKLRHINVVAFPEKQECLLVRPSLLCWAKMPGSHCSPTRGYYSSIINKRSKTCDKNSSPHAWQDPLSGQGPSKQHLLQKPLSFPIKAKHQITTLLGLSTQIYFPHHWCFWYFETAGSWVF